MVEQPLEPLDGPLWETLESGADSPLHPSQPLAEPGRRHVICGHEHEYCGVSRAGWRPRGWVAAQRLAFGSAGGVRRRTWVGVTVVPRFVEHQRAKGLMPEGAGPAGKRYELAGKGRLQKKDRLQGWVWQN